MRSRKDGAELLFVPDTQIRPGDDIDHVKAAGNYAYHRKPSIIVLAGDWHDLPSLSLWDSPAQKALKKRRLLSDDPDIEGDIECGNRALRAFRKAVHGKSRTYRPRIVLTVGNHENRLVRFQEEYPHLGAALSEKLFDYEGLEVYPYLKPVVIEGVAFAHFFCTDTHGRVMNLRRGQASARQQVLNVGMSAIAGHRQGLDTAILERQSGRKRGIIAGSFYPVGHYEDYLGPQGNSHWRGCLYLHELCKGDFDLMELSLDYLMERWA